MDSKLTILYVNRWRGIIGPNVGMKQFVDFSLARGHRVHVATPWRDEFIEAFEAAGVQIHQVEGLEFLPRSVNPLRVGAYLLRNFRGAKRLGQLARQVGADLICINSENMLMAPRAGKLAGCPVVVVIQGVRFQELGAAGRAFFAIQKRWVTRYLAMSETIHQALLEMGVEPERIAVVYAGVDTAAFTPGPPNKMLARELGIAPGSVVIGTVCNLEPRKGVNHLIEVFAAVARQLPQACCLVVGQATSPADRQFVDALKARTAALGLSDSVIFAGWRTDIPDMLRLMDVVVHPSETESFGRSIAEAMACAKPVVGFAVGAVKELIADGQSGYVVVPFDHAAMAEKVVQLAADPALRQTIGQAARQRAVRLYDLQRNLAATLDTFESISNGG